MMIKPPKLPILPLAARKDLVSMPKKGVFFAVHRISCLRLWVLAKVGSAHNVFH
jgi:hypothetical protein